MKRCISVLAVALSGTTFAQNYATGFEAGEGYSGSAWGVAANGQQGWYNPATDSDDGLIYTYSSNAPGVATNPAGGDQFLGGQVSGNVIRSQRSYPFGNTGLWSMQMDFVGTFSGTPPASEYLGSVSLQPAVTANYFLALYAWAGNTGDPVRFDAAYGVFMSGGGGALDLQFVSPGPAWTNLPVNNWFRQTTVWDYTTNRIVSVTLQNLTTGGAVETATPTDWYLSGGADNSRGFAPATDLRLFIGGSSAGNTMGFDNLTLAPVPEPASLVAIGLGALGLLRRRRK